MQQQDEERKLEQRIVSRFHKALTRYNLINDGDKILVGVSGGKDSLCLLEMMAKRMKIQRPNFTVEAVHIRMSNIHYETDTTYLQTFAEECGVPLHIVTTEFEQRENSRKPTCFLCSWHRRKQIFNLAQELGCNKIALGHHMDDIIHTALMNLFYQGQFTTMPAKLTMRKMPLTIIRPLCMEIESDITHYSQVRGYERQIKLCPFETTSHRSDIRFFFEENEKSNPEARYSIWNALETADKLVE